MLTITTTHRPATDLGFLLHKHPDRLQTFGIPSGNAHVFYPEANEERCTAALMLEIDPIRLTRRGSRSGSTPDSLLQDYVNDRPYTASSHLSVAINRVFGTAMSGRCNDRPDLVGQPIPLEAGVASVRSRRSAELIHRIFEPLGYTVETETLPMDPGFPDWGDGHHHNLVLRSETHTLRELLVHLYVLLPVMDNQKHYWISDDELEKLMRFGKDWLNDHPERDLISRRYLGHRRNLTAQAQEQFASEQLASEDLNQEQPTGGPAGDETQGEIHGETQGESGQVREEALERSISLAGLRNQAVLEELGNCGAASVLDLGCGEGNLLRDLMKEPRLTSITGMDVSLRALEIAERRLHLRNMPPEQRKRLTLAHGSLIYRDPRLDGADAAVAMEVIEHIDPTKLGAFEDAILGAARPCALMSPPPTGSSTRSSRTSGDPSGTGTTGSSGPGMNSRTGPGAQQSAAGTASPSAGSGRRTRPTGHPPRWPCSPGWAPARNSARRSYEHQHPGIQHGAHGWTNQLRKVHPGPPALQAHGDRGFRPMPRHRIR